MLVVHAKTLTVWHAWLHTRFSLIMVAHSFFYVTRVQSFYRLDILPANSLKTLEVNGNNSKILIEVIHVCVSFIAFIDFSVCVLKHFVCAKCEKPFLGTRHYEKKGLAYCETHYHQVNFFCF